MRMKLSEKVLLLRKENGMSQELLAEKCGVSRQAISKWEADTALPATEKLLLLSNLFSVPIDVLLKDDLDIRGVKKTDTCGIVQEGHGQGIYRGVLIKESISDEEILDHLRISKVEIWKTKDIPKYWTAISFISDEADFPERLSRVVISNESRGSNWFVDLKKSNTKIIVFRDRVLKYTIGNEKEKQSVTDECRRFGIPDNQMNWEE